MTKPHAGLTKPTFHKHDSLAAIKLRREREKGKNKASFAVFMIGYTNLVLFIYCLALAYIISIWPEYRTKVMQEEEDRIKASIKISTLEADAWKYYIQDLIFDKYGPNSPWLDKPIPDHD